MYIYHPASFPHETLLFLSLPYALCVGEISAAALAAGRGGRAVPTDLMAWSEEILVTRTDLDEKNQVSRGERGRRG